MADSNITKRALAGALRELMNEIPFEKISVADICQRCDMNRKSFYYHFKDKYDLVNWIFDTEFLSIAVARSSTASHEEHIAFFGTACNYFYENRDFYRKALCIKGQNSFSEHFREYIQPILKDRIASTLGTDITDDFTLAFFTDAFVCSLERWLLDKDCMQPIAFVDKLLNIIERSAEVVYETLNQE